MDATVEHITTHYETRYAEGTVEHNGISARWWAERRLPHGQWLTDRIDFHPEDVDDWHPWEEAIHAACAVEEAVYDRNHAAGMERCGCGRWMEPCEGTCAQCGRKRDDDA